MEQPQEPKPKSNKEERDLWFRKVKSGYEYIKREHDEEVANYIKMYRHEFEGMLPKRLLTSNRVDVNVVYPIVKARIPKLYFRDPKVILKTQQKEIVIEQKDADGKSIVDPNTGQPQVDRYDAVESAKKFQGVLNQNIKDAKLKKATKSALLDAQLGFYGALMTGWGNDQGVASMPDAETPPIVRSDVKENMGYSIRLQPWNVIPDMTDFENPEWVAIRYAVKPSQLKADKRLRNTENLKGTHQVEGDVQKKRYRLMKNEETALVEYFAVYIKPCADYPTGKFYMLTEEVKEDFLFDSDWPFGKTNELPVKFLYFNPDPDGGLPIPPVRYYASQQKAKTNLRNTLYQYVQRIIPIFGIDINKCDKETKDSITNGNVPRVAKFNGNPNQAMGSSSFNNLNADFHRMDGLIDDDISRSSGEVKGVHTGGDASTDLATVANLQDQNEQIRSSEDVDIVSEFITAIVQQWKCYYQEFTPTDNKTVIDGQSEPVEWISDEIQGLFLLEIKPFSMSYEDPVIKRRQWVDLLNLLSAPELKMAISSQGSEIDYVKIVKRILETYDERDVETFMLSEMAIPENQVARAIEENVGIQQGVVPQIQPTDNHKIHIMIHGLTGDLLLEHMSEHNAILTGVPVGSSGGGNKEGLPVNGVAVKQDMMKQPVNPSSINQNTAITREATSER